MTMRLKQVKRYWSVPRVVFTYVTARVFYDILIAIWRGPGRVLLYVIVGAVIVALIP